MYFAKKKLKWLVLNDKEARSSKWSKSDPASVTEMSTDFNKINNGNYGRARGINYFTI